MHEATVYKYNYSVCMLSSTYKDTSKLSKAMNTLFIHTNHKQILGAKLSKYSFEKEAYLNRNFETKIIIAEEFDEMKNFVGKTYFSGNRLVTYTLNDLQSFTLTRFAPPQLMGFKGRAIVIDPDIFALPKTNISDLFDMDLEGNDLAATKRKGSDTWESSLMVLDCEKLTHWNLTSILRGLEQRTIDREKLMGILRGESVKKISNIWNSIEKIDLDTKAIHITNRLTQPWKTNLPIDFRINPMPKIFGIIPREPIHKFLGKYPTHYLPHPDEKIVSFFFSLLRSALEDGAVSEKDIENEIHEKNVRSDIFEILNN